MELPPSQDVERFLRGASVRSIEAHSANGLLRKTAALWVTTDAPVFDFKLLPLEHSRGLVGWNGEEMRILSSAEPANLSWLLRSEGDLSGFSAEALARLCSDSLLGRGNSRHRILGSLAEIDELCAAETFGGKFVVSKAMREEIGSRLSPPVIVSESGGMYHLTFFTLHGWMHRAGELCCIRVFIDPDLAVSVSSDVVLENVFEAMPFVRY
jgi:hypothetical protein